MRFLAIICLALIVSSCGKKVAYTNQVREEFGLENEQNIKKVQFYTSQTIILERSKKSGNSNTSDGVLVNSSSQEQDRVIIPANTKGIFEEFAEDGSIVVRFEIGVAKTLSFRLRQESATGKYFLVADWVQGQGGQLSYGNETYTVPSSAGNSYLMVVVKNLQKTKRKDRIVKGMKV